MEAITDETLKKLAEIPSKSLYFLDISFAKRVTDEGLKAFEGKEFPLTHLFLNGLCGVSGQGLAHPI